MSTVSDIPSPPVHQEPLVFEADMEKAHEAFERLADRYGGKFYVRIGQEPVLVLANAEDIYFVLKKRPELFAPWSKYIDILTAAGIDGLEASDGMAWKVQREILGSVLDSKCLQRYSVRVSRAAGNLVAELVSTAAGTSTKDLEKTIYLFTCSVYMDILLGDLVEEYRYGWERYEEMAYGLMPLLKQRIDPIMQELHHDDFSVDADFEDRMARLVGFVERLIQERQDSGGCQEKPPENSGMLSALLDTVAARGLKIDDVNLLKNIFGVISAAVPTTTQTLLNVMAALADNRKLQEELQHELDSCGAIEKALRDPEDLKELKCLERIIQETMRMASVSRLVLVQARKDTVLDGINIPKGTPLALLIAYCGTRGEHFTNSGRFDPRRWQPEYRPDYEPHNIKAFLPFGAGPRACPGRGLAMIVMKTALAAIFGSFTVDYEKPSCGSRDNGEYDPAHGAFRLEPRHPKASFE